VSGEFEIRNPYRKKPSHEYGKKCSAAENSEIDLLIKAVYVSPDRSHASRLKRHLSGK
jgi:hypothetical protein